MEKIQIKGVHSYQFWAWVVLFFLTVSGLLVPNFIAFTFILLASYVFFIWAYGWKIEGKFFKVVSALSMIFAFCYVMAVFILRIDYLEDLNTEWWQFILGLTWNVPNGSTQQKKSTSYGISQIVIALA